MVRRDFKSVAPVEWPAFKACYDSGVLERLLAFAAQHALFVPGQRIGVAVSGGADSVFLFRALHQLAPRWNPHLSVVHIDHGIRGEASREDAEFVRALAAEHGLPFHLHQADVLATEGNLEQAARRASSLRASHSGRGRSSSGVLVALKQISQDWTKVHIGPLPAVLKQTPAYMNVIVGIDDIQARTGQIAVY